MTGEEVPRMTADAGLFRLERSGRGGRRESRAAVNQDEHEEPEDEGLDRVFGQRRLDDRQHHPRPAAHPNRTWSWPYAAWP